MIGAALELFALWRIGSKLEQMDRRQAEMNEVMIAGHSRGAERLEPSLCVEEAVFDDFYDEPPPARSWREWYDGQEAGDGFRWKPPAPVITVEPVARAVPQIAAQKVTWWSRLLRWLSK
jgi:hypothetical protein